MILFAIGMIPALPLCFCVWTWFQWKERKGLAGHLLPAVGWLSVWSFVAAIAQLIYHAVKTTGQTFELEDLPAMLPFSWWVLLGGHSVQLVFEETAKAVTGHRQMTMIDNWPYYVVLTYAQTLVLAGLAAWRSRGRSWSDPLLVLLGILVLANGALGLRWPWWGS